MEMSLCMLSSHHESLNPFWLMSCSSTSMWFSKRCNICCNCQSWTLSEDCLTLWVHLISSSSHFSNWVGRHCWLRLSISVITASRHVSQWNVAVPFHCSIDPLLTSMYVATKCLQHFPVCWNDQHGHLGVSKSTFSACGSFRDSAGLKFVLSPICCRWRDRHVGMYTGSTTQ